MVNPKNKWAKHRRLDLIKDFGGFCSWEGCVERDPDLLEFAHVKPTKLSGRGRGRIKRFQDISTHRDSYRLLCKDHHEEFDDR